MTEQGRKCHRAETADGALKQLYEARRNVNVLPAQY